MTPIISPWLFYWAEVFDIFKGFGGFLGLAVFIISGFILAGIYGDKVKDTITKEEEALYPMVKHIFIFGLIIALLALFTPSKQTLYTMYISSNITQENLNKFSDNVDTLIDKVIEKAHKYSNGGNKR